MQGKKHYQEKLFTNFQLSDRVPAENIYRKLKETLDFQFLYVATASIMGKMARKALIPLFSLSYCLLAI